MIRLHRTLPVNIYFINNGLRDTRAIFLCRICQLCQLVFELVCERAKEGGGEGSSRLVCWLCRRSSLQSVAMAVLLGGGQSWGLKQEAAERGEGLGRRTVLMVKLTDASLRALEEHARRKQRRNPDSRQGRQEAAAATIRFPSSHQHLGVSPRLFPPLYCWTILARKSSYKQQQQP